VTLADLVAQQHEKQREVAVLKDRRGPAPRESEPANVA
jgi:hypothetical protein